MRPVWEGSANRRLNICHSDYSNFLNRMINQGIKVSLHCGDDYKIKNAESGTSGATHIPRIRRTPAVWL